MLPKYGHSAYLDIVEHTHFGLTDFIVGLLNKVGRGFSECEIMSLLEPEHDCDHDSDDEKHSDLFNKRLRRVETIRCHNDASCDLLSIDKQALFKMKTEFHE